MKDTGFSLLTLVGYFMSEVSLILMHSTQECSAVVSTFVIYLLLSPVTSNASSSRDVCCRRSLKITNWQNLILCTIVPLKLSTINIQTWASLQFFFCIFKSRTNCWCEGLNFLFLSFIGTELPHVNVVMTKHTKCQVSESFTLVGWNAWLPLLREAFLRLPYLNSKVKVRHDNKVGQIT